MNFYGYMGKILYVNLTTGEMKQETLDTSLVHDYIGNLGINSKLAYDLIEPGIDPLSPQNCLIYGTGPFGGTIVPGCSRSELTSKSPLTHFLGTSNSGDSVALMIKFAGYDHLVISGKASKPVYLKICDDDVEICDAQHVWGRDIWETTDILREELGDYWINTIGCAGEQLVRYACTVTNKHSVYGRTGMGAVMGSKHLKAVAAQGTRGIQLADQKSVFSIAEDLLHKMKNNPATKIWRELGFVAAFPAYSANGLFERYNYSEGFPDLTEVFSKDEYKARIVKKAYACPSCPIGCKQILEMKDGEFAGLNYKVAALGSQVGYHNLSGVESWDKLAKCVELENRYGIDSNSLGGCVGFAIELYKNRIITKKDTGGMELDWGGETTLALIEMIAKREGIGDILADGVQEAVKKIGSNSEQYAVHIKGLDMALGVRGRLSTENFGQLTNPRGAHLDRSTSLTFTPRKPEVFPRYCTGIGVPEKKIDKVCDGPEGFNVSRLTKWVEDYNTIFICLGMCHRTPVTQHFDLEILTELYNATTGLDITPSQLRKAGERVWNLQRAFNQREGAYSVHDKPPKRVQNEKLIIGDKEYPPLTEHRVYDLLKQYYEERGWNTENGKLTKEKLKELDLREINSDLDE